MSKLVVWVFFHCLKPYLYPVQEVKDAIQLQPIQSLQNFAHVMAAQMLCHVQKFVRITSLEFVEKM